MKFIEILLLAGVSIVSLVLMAAVFLVFARLLAIASEILNDRVAIIVSLVIAIVGVLTCCGIAEVISEAFGAIENWDREKGIYLLGDAEESKLIADVQEKGSRIVVVKDGEMHEYYILTENNESSDAQEDGDDTAVR